MPTQSNQQFQVAQLGFLNNAQDPTNLKTFEAAEISAIDMDAQALGTLKSSNYLSLASGENEDLLSTTLNGLEFGMAPAGYFGYMNQYDVLTAYQTWMNDKSTKPTVTTSEDGVGMYKVTEDLGGLFSISVDEFGPYEWRDPSDQVSVRILSTISHAPDVYIRLTISTGGLSDVSTPYNTPFAIFGSTVTGTLQTGVVTGQVAQIRSEVDILPDGDYAYRTRDIPVGTDPVALNAVPKVGALPQRAPSDIETVRIQNFDSIGTAISSAAPYVVATTPEEDGQADVYRRDESELDMFIVKDREFTDGAFVDKTRLVELDSLNILDKDDESEADLMDAIGVTAGNFGQYSLYAMFNKDNRLFRILAQRRDLMLFSRPGEWWGWQRANSFVFDSNITKWIEVRDESVVGGQRTMVVFTETSIYHLVGNGTEEAPYVLTRQVENITVDPKSVVNLNGTIMFHTKSDTGEYDLGAYGQKVYEYNLQQVIEVSATVKNSATILDTADVEFAEMLGGDKYIMKKTGNPVLMIYHRDAASWSETNEADETAGVWTWLSKDFTPTVMDRFKIQYARKFKLDFEGDIQIEFSVWYRNRSEAQVYRLNFSSDERREVMNFLPPVKGSVWNVKLIGTNATLYNMYLVR